MASAGSVFQVGHDLAHLQRAGRADGGGSLHFRYDSRMARVSSAGGGGRRLQAGQRLGESGRRGIDRQRGAVHARQLGAVGMHMDQLLARHRDVQRGVGLAGVFGHAAADQQDQVGVGHALEQRRVDAQAHVADVAGMVGREQHLAPERHRGRQRVALGERGELLHGLLAPAAAAQDGDGPGGLGQQLFQVGQLADRGRGVDGRVARRVGHRGGLDQHVLGQRDHHGAGAARVAMWKARETSSGMRST